MKVIVDGNAVCLVADDFVDLQKSEAVWLKDADVGALRRLVDRDAAFVTELCERHVGLSAALRAYRSALRSGEKEGPGLRRLGDVALSGADETRASGLCAVVSASGPNGEPLACGYEPDHDGPHSWASLPTFTRSDGEMADLIRAISYPGPDAWTSILNLVREHAGEVHYQATNLCHFARRVAEINPPAPEPGPEAREETKHVAE